MKNEMYCVLGLVSLAVLGPASITAPAQSKYLPYAFTNFAGSPGLAGSADGAGSAARFQRPGSIVVDGAGMLYVADFGNHTIRKITPEGQVTTLAGLAGHPGTADGPGADARFNGPATLDVDSNGNLYVTDYNNHTIRKVTPGGVVTTVAGQAGVPGAADGPSNSAQFRNPIGVAVDGSFNVYVADFGNHTIRKVTSDGTVTTFAGATGVPGHADGTGTAARFNGPHHVRADAAGNLYVADSQNSTIRKITPDAQVTTLAGKAGIPGGVDGAGRLARFQEPFGLAVTPNGSLYVADTFNQMVRRISPSGMVTTLGGLKLSFGTSDGTGSSARFYEPISVAIDRAGYLYVVDFLNHRISKGTPLLQFDPEGVYCDNSGARVHARLIGPPASDAVVMTSLDQHSWSPLQTNLLGPEGFEISMPIQPGQCTFFRAHLAP